MATLPPRARQRAMRTAVAAVCVALVVILVVSNVQHDEAESREPVSLIATASIQRLQAKLFVAQQHMHAYEDMEQAVKTAKVKYESEKAEHDTERHRLAKQELLLDNVMETAKEMSLAQKRGKVSAFNHAVSQLDSGMSELKSSLASAQCPPKSGGQAALNMCLIKQQLGQAAVIKQGDTSSKSMAALRSALESTEQTGRQLDRSDARLRQDIDKAQAKVRLHAAWGEQVLKEQGDFARLAAAYLPGKQSRDLTKVWPSKPAAALSLLSGWMERHDSWGLSSLAEMMRPTAPRHFDPTADRR